MITLNVFTNKHAFPEKCNKLPQGYYCVVYHKNAFHNV